MIKRHMSACLLAAILVSSISLESPAAGFSGAAEIEEMQVAGGGYLWIKLDATAANPNSCTMFDGWFYMITGAGGAITDIKTTFYSTALAAFMAGKKVDIYSGSCSGNYNLIDILKIVP